MCGSGTTPRVACEMGRKYIGIDISPEYCEIARERVKNIESQPALFIFEDETAQL
jgi:DNA modification methylase